MDELSLSDFHYDLPEHQVPAYPLPQRDASKLLYYHKGRIQHRQFIEIADLLPSDSLLVFNDTKVIPARLNFRRKTGSRIEVLLMEPALNGNMEKALNAPSPVVWECIIGGLKKWKTDETLELSLGSTTLKAKIQDKEKNLVQLEWNSEEKFCEIINKVGKIPLPPYLNREAEESDKERYQTLVAKNDGAIAAPTAALHFSERVFESLDAKGIRSTRITLHVGSGTFLPVKEGDPRNHPMHNEKIVFSRQAILDLLNHSGSIVPVGTTSMRSLESLYWWGCKLVQDPEADFFVEKLEPYVMSAVSRQDALKAVWARIEKDQMDELRGETEILILPAYQFGMCDALVTNFHQPSSTLIMLVAAFVGQDWRWIYSDALSKKYRFLSYGDSSLLIP